MKKEIDLVRLKDEIDSRQIPKDIEFYLAVKIITFS